MANAKTGYFNLLKRFFSANPEVEFLTFDAEECSVLFSCERELGPGEHSVVARFGGEKLNSKVTVESFEAGTYYGRFLEPLAALPYLTALLPQPARFVENRQAQRFERVLRVMSAGLPGYQAVSTDLSMTGMKLKVGGALEIGLEFDCQVEFEDHSQVKLPLRCQVRWCQPQEGYCLVGVQFLEVSKPTRSRLAHFVDVLSKVERGVLPGEYQRSV